MIAGIVFDAYGTLFDVFAVETRLEAMFPGKGRAISQMWRVRQVDYTRLSTLSGGYSPFWELTGDALDYACDFEGVALSAPARAELLAFYERLPSLRTRGLTLGVLTNADGPMVTKALAAADVRGFFTHVLSVERVRKFKTAPEAYRLGPDAFGAPASALVFVSSNGWDAAAAAAFGYRAYWINRMGAPRERIGAAPEGEGRTMADLVGFLIS
jgi:2-haloacid dehalogenase